METNLTTTLRNTIEALRNDVTENLKIIRSNEKIVRQILNQGRQNEESEKIKALYEQNRNLLNQNKEAINIQLKMINFLNSYRVPVVKDQPNSQRIISDSFTSKEENEPLIVIPESLNKKIINMGMSEIDSDDYFTLTIENKIVFNKNHPYYDNDEFYSKLLDYYKKTENYEMCARIVRK